MIVSAFITVRFRQRLRLYKIACENEIYKTKFYWVSKRFFHVSLHISMIRIQLSTGMSLFISSNSKVT